MRYSFDLAISSVRSPLPPAVQRASSRGALCLVPGGALVRHRALPPLWSPGLWLAAGFDATMWLRNRLWRPPFVMYYLAWPLQRTLRLLRQTGFEPEVRPLALPRPLSRMKLVLARRR